ncbi:MAG: PAS domain S-box protein [Burkholderiaceae bacterium]|jgi:PAS domain S-box-containing protein|nr:PAS domain S-box protein [Burkholderiaceae bacterium]
MRPVLSTIASDGVGGVSVPGRHRLSWFRQDRFVHLVPLATVLLFLAVVISAFWYLRLEEVRREQEAVKRDVEYGQQRLRLRLLERQEQLMRLARDIANHDIDPLRFGFHAESLAMQYPELLVLSWIGKHGQVIIVRTSPSINAPRDWMTDGALKAGETKTNYDLARDLLQPVYSQPVAVGDGVPVLQLHIPFTFDGRFAGELLAEYSIDALLRYGVPSEILAKYAAALLDSKGQILAGQSIPDRSDISDQLPWAAKVNEFETPVSPVGNGLILRIQAWRTSQSVLGNALFWLAATLSVLTVWMLLYNWHQTRRRQQAQAALQTETGFRRAMENSMLTGMRALDLQGRISYVNPAFCQMTGWSESELIGQSEPFSYWPEADRETLTMRLAEELSGTADTAGFQMRVKRKDGSLFDARLYVSPLIDAAGKQTGWMASMTDITEPNRVRQQLAASYQRFTTVLEALDASVSVAPLGSKELLFANKLYRQWFGDTSSGHMKLVMRASTLPRHDASESLDAVDTLAGLPLDSLAASPAAEQDEVYIERLDKWLEVRSRYLHWVDGRLAQLVIATDITARRRAEEQAAAQADRAQTASRLIIMGEMASSVAHELNQPLTAISNYCTGMISRVRGGGIGSEDLLTTLEKTAWQAQRAGQVVQHIRNFVKRSEPQRQWSEVPAMIEQVVELAEIELRRRQVRLTHHVDANLPALFVDPILIEQVLINLIKNGAESVEAAQRSPNNRVVDLRVTQRGVAGMAAVQFVVADTGSGLAPEVLDHLYEAFFSTKNKGLGIGLNLCRSIIESHQGRIATDNLYNAGQIAGCRFIFWVPVSPSLGTSALPSHSNKVVV